MKLYLYKQKRQICQGDQYFWLYCCVGNLYILFASKHTVLKPELNGTKAYEETSIDEKSVVYSYSNEMPNKFAVDVKERQDRLPTMYWLPKLHKRPYKARFIANSNSFTTTEISKLLTSCLTAIKAKVIKYCETVYERSGKICSGL